MISPTVISWIVVVLVLGFGGWRIYKDLKEPQPKQIKKTKIIHFSHHGRYACNEEVETTEEKLTEEWEKVTCKNCPKVNFYH